MLGRSPQLSSLVLGFLLFHALPTALLANRDTILPDEYNVINDPTASPTASPTMNPTRSPIAKPPVIEACQLSQDMGSYGITDNVDSTIQILFDYEMRYDEGYESQLNTLLSDLELKLGEIIIKNSIEGCRDGRRMRRLEFQLVYLRRAESDFDLNHAMISGHSSSPTDYILEGDICPSEEARCRVVVGGLTVYRNNNPEDEGSQDIVSGTIDEENEEEFLTDEEVKQKLSDIVELSMNTGLLSSSIDGIHSLLYLGDANLDTDPSERLATYPKKVGIDEDHFPLYAIILVIIAGCITMVTTGFLIKKYRDR